MDDMDMVQLIMQLPPEQREALFRNFPQEQAILGQQMDMATQMQRPGPQHSTPWGALLGGLSDALGKGGGAYMQGKTLDAQKVLGQDMSKDASKRFELMAGMNEQQMRNKALLDAINLSPATLMR